MASPEPAQKLLVRRTIRGHTECPFNLIDRRAASGLHNEVIPYVSGPEFLKQSPYVRIVIEHPTDFSRRRTEGKINRIDDGVKTHSDSRLRNIPVTMQPTGRGHASLAIFLLGLVPA